MTVYHRVRFLMVTATLVAVQTSAQHSSASPTEPLFSGDWVGQFMVGDSAIFVRARFTDASPEVRGSVDLPQSNSWGLRLFAVRLTPPSLSFAFVFRGDTARFEGRADRDSIHGDLRVGRKAGNFHLIHRMAYDSAAVRRLAGNYRIARDRVISMGPMDEAGGWLAFFDSKTRRGGILYALSDTVFFTGPTFSIDYPIAIRADVRLDAGGNVRGLVWRERGTGPREATRLDDHVSEDVTFQNGRVRLAGTVTVPSGAARHPAVILIHGAGARSQPGTSAIGPATSPAMAWRSSRSTNEVAARRPETPIRPRTRTWRTTCWQASPTCSHEATSTPIGSASTAPATAATSRRSRPLGPAVASRSSRFARGRREGSETTTARCMR